MATSSNDSGFESAVNAIFGYDISLEKLLWKLCPVYFKVKCKEDFITTVQICTSEDGKKVYLKIYVINELSLSRIVWMHSLVLFQINGMNLHIHFKQLFQ